MIMNLTLGRLMLRLYNIYVIRDTCLRRLRVPTQSSWIVITILALDEYGVGTHRRQKSKKIFRKWNFLSVKIALSMTK